MPTRRSKTRRKAKSVRRILIKCRWRVSWRDVFLFTCISTSFLSTRDGFGPIFLSKIDKWSDGHFYSRTNPNESARMRKRGREKLCKYHSDLTHSIEFTTRLFPLIESQLCSRKSIGESRFVQLEWRNWLLINSEPNSSHNNILIRIELISSTDV